MKIRSLLILLAGTAIGVSLTLGSGVLADRTQPADGGLPWEHARLLAEVMERIRREYVEPIDDQQLIESAVRGMVQALDPHSQFLDSHEYEEIRISTSGNYSGVGLEVHLQDGKVSVITPIEGTPADRAGIRPGDTIVSIDSAPIEDGSINDAIRRLRGRAGTPVTVGIIREGEPRALEFQLTRSHVRVQSVRAQLLEGSYGYLRISQFSEGTGRELRRALRDLVRQNGGPLEGLVLDLRNNPGGVLEAGVEVADAFLDQGTIVSASGRARDANFRHEARPGDVLDGARMVVMVNAGSASAAEIVAGALRDNNRATIVGGTTFGKGSVQTVMPLAQGRAIKLTTSRYFTPHGDSIHGAGITPDITLIDSSREDQLANTLRHVTEAGAALLASDGQLRQAYELLRESRILHSRAD
ncbi:MAG: S41 family peptidase [Chromatiales bacterium]|nr:S41 family peptidase [Chromatiales bacterium]